ncbi:MAG: hypothetical protein GF347_03450, partial [Candidatus Moranbacteria bacterium]|nr:hypothetical protein [Candidatus Moranbacteria bacterium]
MKFLFLDEFKKDFPEDPEKRKFYGVIGVCIDEKFYRNFKENFYKELKEIGWSLKKEYKGRFLFSQKSNKSVEIEKRINFTEKIIKEGASNKKSRMKIIIA